LEVSLFLNLQTFFMIETKAFSISPTEYFKIVLTKRFKKSWLVYLIMIASAIFGLFLPEKDKVLILLIVVGFGYPVFIIVYLYFWVRSSENNQIYQERKFTFFDDKLMVETQNGAKTEFPYSEIVSVREKNNIFLIYITKSQFFYVPKNAFKSDLDFEGFIQKIKKI
jgi:hypothetical protein